jgi:hypothetical protein
MDYEQEEAWRKERVEVMAELEKWMRFYDCLGSMVYCPRLCVVTGNIMEPGTEKIHRKVDLAKCCGLEVNDDKV